MSQWKHCWSITLVSAAMLLCSASAQDLESLVAESEEEEAELRSRQTEGILGPEEEGVAARIRLPKGEQLERLRISQDRAVDPQLYIVGPGDLLQLYIWGEFDQSVPFTVNPEGHALIPTIGSFYVANRTLADIREEIIAAAQREMYPGVDITLTLISMRFFTVYLTGAVATEGAHVVHPITRVSELIEFGGGFSDDLRGTIEETLGGRKITRAARVQSQPTARRAIRVTHADGTSEEVDLAMFNATGDLRHNPYVFMGDRVHVPYRTESVHIYGAVNEEGEKEYRRGDTVRDLVLLASGALTDRPLDRAEIWRFAGDGKTTRRISLMESEDPGFVFTVNDIDDLPLEPDDMVFLRARSEWNLSPNVAVYGEVPYRGRYRILSDHTRLLEILEEAGGITDRASLKDAKLIRVKLRDQADPELERLLALQQVSGNEGMDPEERAYLKTKARQERGRVAIDFERLLAGDESQNILLEGGDVILIPEKRNTVNMSGQFRKPGLIDYQDDRTVAYYLEQAGGYSFRADKGGARLIRARTGQRESLQGDSLVEPGDEIWVPETQYRDWWGLTRETMTFIAQTLTLVVLVRAL